MRAGSAIHAALNALRSGADVTAACVAAAKCYTSPALVRPLDQVERIVHAYAARYPREDEPFTIVETEQYREARIHVPHPLRELHLSFTYCGILDSVICQDGAEYVMDCKSTGAYLNKGFFDTLSISDQLVGYVALRRALGKPCNGFYVDAIHVNDKTGKVDPTKDFARYGPVRVEDWQVQKWARDAYFTLGQIAELEAERGIDTPWPVYSNWMYGKIDAYRDFYTEPAELHAQTMKLFARQEWSPRAVAEGRAFAT